ncbi:hypothetical protein [Streptomyces sp. NPDC056975]|uniref:hypothetical protein n=1 Tax=unclassified Streptomyces TaxID=2593676 RepID=UPI003632D043
MSQLEDEQHGLGGDAADPPAADGFDGFGEGTFCVTVVSLDAVAQPEVDLLPLRAPYSRACQCLDPSAGARVMLRWRQTLSGPAGFGSGSMSGSWMPLPMDRLLMGHWTLPGSAGHITR